VSNEFVGSLELGLGLQYSLLPEFMFLFVAEDKSHFFSQKLY